MKSSACCRNIKTSNHLALCLIFVFLLFQFNSISAAPKQIKTYNNSGVSLISGYAVSKSINKRSWHAYEIAPAPNGTVRLELKTLSGNANLYARFYESPTFQNYNCKSAQYGTDSDSCLLTVPNACRGTDCRLHIEIYGEQKSQYSIKAVLEDNIPIFNPGQTIHDSSVKYSTKYYKFNTTPNTHKAKIKVKYKGNFEHRSLNLRVKVGEMPHRHDAHCEQLAGKGYDAECVFYYTYAAPVYFSVGAEQYSSIPFQYSLSVEMDESSSLLTSGQSVSRTLSADRIDSYKISSPGGAVVVELSNNTFYAALMAQSGAMPALYNNHDCLKNTRGGVPTSCSLNLDSPDTVYIRVEGYAGTYTLKATVANPEVENPESEITTLISGQEVSGTAEDNYWKYYKILSEPTTQKVIGQIIQWTGDPKLFLRPGTLPSLSYYYCKSHPDTTCEVPVVHPETVYIGLYYGDPEASYTLKANLKNVEDIEVLTSGQEVSGAVEANSWKYYKISSNSTTKEVIAQMRRWTGNPNLFLKRVALPAISAYDCKSDGRNTQGAICSSPMNHPETIYFGVRSGQFPASYSIKATLEKEKDVEILHSGQAVQGRFDKDQIWKYYRIHARDGDKGLRVESRSLMDSEVDLYVRKGDMPNRGRFDCRSEKPGTETEYCYLPLTAPGPIYIGIKNSLNLRKSFWLNVELLTENRAALLLHGLSSDHTTWDDLVNDEHGFQGKCVYLPPNSEEEVILTPANNQGIYCFRLRFGHHDTRSGNKLWTSDPQIPKN